MTIKKGMLRKNIQLSEKLASWYEQESNSMGITQSALMVTALQHYVDFRESMKVSKQLPDFMEMFNQLNEMQKNSKS